MGAGAAGASEQQPFWCVGVEVFEMHMVIYALVEASTHDGALATGKTVFDRLVGADPHSYAVFDYYVCFDEEDTSVAGKARWGDLPTAAPADSDDGQELLDRGWEATKEEFERNLERVKEALDELSDEEIMHDEDLYRNTETGARAVLHRAPDSYRYKWRAAILVDGYPVWSRGFETKKATTFRDVLRDKPTPELTCPECPNDDVVVGQKSADCAKVQRWFDCPDCGYEGRSKIIYGAKR